MMRKLASALVLTALSTLFSPASPQAQDANLSPPKPITLDETRRLMDKVVDEVIRPGYRSFSTSSSRLTDAMRQLCAEPSAETLAAGRAAFEAAALDWGHIEIVRIGPVIEDNRFERVLFYPDRKSTGLRQVQGLLATPDEDATSPVQLARKSVAMQGLGALESVLHGTGSDALVEEVDGFRCRYGLAVAGSIQRVATELSQIWDDPAGIQKDWKEPGADSRVFRTPGEAVTAVLGLLVHSAEAARDQRIETFYKGEDNSTFPKQALFWRSGLTFKMLAANLEGIRTLLDRSEIRDLLNDDQQSIVTSIQFVLRSLIRVARDMEPDVEVAVSDPLQRQKLDFLLLNSRDLILRLNDQLGSGLGLGAGFSFSDGD